MSNRTLFARSLAAALAAANPGQHLKAVLRQELVGELPTWDMDEQDVVRRLAERLDAAGDTGGDIVSLARHVHALLECASSIDEIDHLLDVILERDRFLDILGKAKRGTISRTSLLSFVSSRPWPDVIRRRIATLEKDELDGLQEALTEVDIAKLARLLNGG